MKNYLIELYILISCFKTHLTAESTVFRFTLRCRFLKHNSPEHKIVVKNYNLFAV
jgi:hypothetical protein